GRVGVRRTPPREAGCPYVCPPTVAPPPHDISASRSLRVWRWQKPKVARELCRATLGRTAGVLLFHSSLEGLTDKGVLCSGNHSEQFYTDATRPSDLA